MANEQYRVFPEAVGGQLARIFDRVKTLPGINRLYWPERDFVQGADLNEAFSIERNERHALASLLVFEGDKIEGCDVISDTQAGTVTITDGELFILGTRRKIQGATLSGVPMSGSVTIGYQVTSDTVTHENEPAYKGLYDEGSLGFNEPGAVRERLYFAWAVETPDSGFGFYPFVRLFNGEVISQDAPPALSGVNQQIAAFAINTLGNFVSNGCEVHPLGKIGDAQHFSVEAGLAYVLGQPINRPTSNRHIEVEAPDLETVVAESHLIAHSVGDAGTVNLNKGPALQFDSVSATLQKNTILSRGTGDQDDLPDGSVRQINSVSQSATTFAAGVDYELSGAAIRWLSGGNAPALGSSYDVDYHYLQEVTPDSTTPTSVTISGAVNNAEVLISYKFALPRNDIICLDADGNVQYIKGISSPSFPLVPQAPEELTKLAEVRNDFFGTPTVTNNGARNLTYEDLQRWFEFSLDTRQIALEGRSRNGIALRAQGRPTGSFFDPLTNDSQRDAGEAQTASVFNDTIQLSIDPDFRLSSLAGPQVLPYSEVPFITQENTTGCVKINPYMVFAPLPGILRIAPSSDFWVERQAIFLSDITRVFGAGNTLRTLSNVVNSAVEASALANLRQIPIQFTISQFGVGEILDSLTFDGIDVLPANTPSADADGVISGSFTIPANVSSGSKSVVAIGGSGTLCSAQFTGQGTLEITRIQRVTTQERFQIDPPNRGAVSVFGNSASDGRVDPQAQSFNFSFGQHISSIDIKFCEIGNRNEPVIVELVTMENQVPSVDVIAQTEVDMQNVVLDEWVNFRFDTPVYLPASQFFAFVIKTNDPDHSISIADRGGFDAARQEHVTRQPYTSGTRFSSSNAFSWTVHQDSDITFRLNTARFAPTRREILIDTLDLDNVSDVIVGCDVRLPTNNTSVVFELTFSGEPPVIVEPNQPYERTDYFTGQLTVTAILEGTNTASPVLMPDVTVILGTIRQQGTYVSRAFPIGQDKRFDVVASLLLPGSSSVVVEVDEADGNWTEVPTSKSTPIDRGFIEREFSLPNHTSHPEGRLRLTLNGGPDSRLAVADLLAFSE